MVQPRATVNQQVQLGVESTHGTAVPANKLITPWTWTFGPKVATKQITGTGQKYPTASEELTEMSSGKISGVGDFNAGVYILNSIFSIPTPTLVSPSSTVYGWAFKPPIAGPSTTKSYTLMQGNSTDDSEKYPYLMFNGFGYSFDRKQEVSFTGDWFAQTMIDGITITSSPTNVPISAMTGAQCNVYLDSTSGGIGGTQLTDPLNVSFQGSDYFGQYWPINRANQSYTSHVDKRPKNEFKLALQANSTGIAIRSNYLQTGALCYVQVNIQGPEIDVPNTLYASLIHDMACYVSNVGELKDVDGVYAVEYTMQVATDEAWSSGTAQTLTMQNLLSSL